MKIYKVQVTAKFPAYGETPGVVEVLARDSKDAIKQARKEVRENGHTSQDGPLSYKVITE